MKRLLLLAVLFAGFACAAIQPAVDPTLIAGRLAACTEANSDGCAYVKCCLDVCAEYHLDPTQACALDVCADGGK